MKKCTRRRPELEQLEAVVLMSTVSAEAHHAAKSAAPTGPIQLEGTFAVKSVKTPATKYAPTESGLVGYGKLAGLGRSAIIVSETSSAETPGVFELAIPKQGIGVYGAQITLPAKGATVTVPYTADNEGEWYLPDDINLTGTISISDVVARGGKSSYVIKLS